jgi:Na+/H+-translocating membrane pyrophosphatase
MIEFGLLIGAGVLALALAFALGRPLLGRAVKLRLVTSARGAVFGGVRSFLRIHDRVLLAFAALVAVALFVGIGVVRSHVPTDPTESSYALAGWITTAVLLGAASTALATHLAAHAMARTSPRFDEAVKHGATDALREGIHGAGASTLAITAILLLSLTVLAIAAFGSAGGFGSVVGNQPAARNMALLISAYAVGAVIASTVTHTIGGIFVAASSSLDSAIASVGSHLDVPVSRVADLFATIATALVASTVLCVGAATASPGSVGGPTAMALCPLIALAFGTLSSTVGIFVVRTDASEPVGAAIDRGLAVTFALSAASFIGITQWLFGSSWWRLLLAAVVGLLAAMIILLLDRFFSALRARAAAQDEPDAIVLGAWGAGFQRAALLAFVAFVAAIGGFVAGRSTGLDHGGSLGLVLTTLGMLAPAPFVLTTATFATIVARGVAPTRSSAERNTIAERRLESAATGLSSARAYNAVCMAMVAWVVVPAFASLVAVHTKSTLANELRWAVLAASALLGTLLVFWVASAGMRAIVAVVRSCRAPRPEPDDAMMPSAPGSMSSGVQRVATTLLESVRQGIPVVLLTIGVPAIVWALLRLGLGGDSPGALAAATGSLVLGASFAGLAVSLAVDTIGYSWRIENLKKSSDVVRDKSVDVTKKWAKNPRDGAAVVGDTLGSPLQSLVVPCIHALVKLLAAAALALAPLFF